jgi:hypothetical protein
MQANSSLTKFPIPWGNAAGNGYIRSIPTGSQISTTPGAASLTDGFPPVCSLPIAAGGVPPYMQDMNGVLNIITAWLRWYQAGGPIAYDATFQAAIGGYPNGARVLSATVTGRVWQSTIDNNTSNPDTGGAGWTIDNSGRLINVRTYLTAGVYTYSSSVGTTFIIATIVGGGGAGGGAGVGISGFYAVGSGGASGSAASSLLRSGFSAVTIIVGAGGAPIIGGQGNPGGTSSFGSLMSAPGGGGGPTFAMPSGQVGYASQGLPGNVAVGGNIFNSAGQPGPNGLLQGMGPMSGQGAPSIFGGGALNSSAQFGNNAVSPGSGGSGAGATTDIPGPAPGGAGHDGAVVIQEYA